MPQNASRALPPLLPQPKSIVRHPGSFDLRDGLPIVLPANADRRDFETARNLQATARARHGIHLPIEGHLRSADLAPCLQLDRGTATGRAGDRHALRITPDRVEVEADGPAGQRHAIETLNQLIDAGKRLPCCAIADEPDFELRGIMLDISRGKVPRPETIRWIIDSCVALKLNTLMLYTEHTFEFRRHPEIGSDASPLDAQTLRELDDYAADRFVDLIPCLQSLGHMEHILKLPRYQDLAETELGWTIAPVHPETLPLLRDLYDEYLPNFRSRFFNANCDEPWDLGRGRSQARSEELGPGGLYLEHVEKLRELAARHGKRTMIWGDVVHAHPERISELDPRLVMLDWWYEAQFDYDRVRVFAEHGLAFGVCPGTSSWNSLFPRIANSIANISGWARAGREHAALAFINTDWGDFGHYNLQGNSLLAFAWGAQESWSGAADPKAFDRAFSARMFGDRSGKAARLYRELGDVHDPGYEVFNGSPIQYLFFDDLAESTFIAATRKPALDRCERKLERVARKIDDAERHFDRDLQTWAELRYAAEASLFCIHKARAGRAYNDWRARPESLDARGRRKLARELKTLATRQLQLSKQLRKLWLTRSFISNFDTTRKRIARSARSLDHAARCLERNKPPPPPEAGPLTGKEVIAAVRRSIAAG